MINVLVTGAAGFIGFHLAKTLASRPGYSIVCADNFSRGQADAPYTELLAKSNVVGVALDLCEPSAVNSLPDDIDFVYHLAALNGTQNFYERPLDVIRACTLPTMLLAERYSRSKRLKRFVYAGTSESYASTVTQFDWPVPTGEDVPLGIDDIFNPRWSYAASKMHGEVVTAQVGRALDMPISIVRYHNTYGPRMGDKHVIPDFYARARDGRFELFGYEDTRSFMYVDDSVAATILIAETPACRNEIVNVGSEDEITIMDLGHLMMDVAHLKGDIVLHPSPRGSVKRRAPRTSKLKTLTGFHGSTDLRTGLELTAKYYLDGLLGGPS